MYDNVYRHAFQQIVSVNDELIEHYNPQRYRVKRDAPDLTKKEDKDFARALRELFRDTRGTYGSTVLMNREHTTKVKKMFVKVDPMMAKHGVNSEQIEQLKKSSEELAREGTRLPLWGMVTKETPKTAAIDTKEELRAWRELFRDTRGTWGSTVLMNREHTKKVKKMFVNHPPEMIERGVNSEQIQEILKSSEERDRDGGTKFPLIGNVTCRVPTLKI